MVPAAILLDMDGVVVDNMSYHERAWREFFRARGLAMDGDEFFRKTSGMPTRDVLAYFFKREVAGDELAGFHREKEDLYRRLYRPHLAAARGLEAFLNKSRAAGFRVGLGTGSQPENIDFVLDGLSLRPYFDAVVGADDVSNGKPHPETFLTLAERLGVPPARCVVFEDALLGERAARAAGMPVVAVTTSHPRADFEAPVLAVPDFAGLEPQALLKFIG